MSSSNQDRECEREGGGGRSGPRNAHRDNTHLEHGHGLQSTAETARSQYRQEKCEIATGSSTLSYSSKLISAIRA